MNVHVRSNGGVGIWLSANPIRLLTKSQVMCCVIGVSDNLTARRGNGGHGGSCCVAWGQGVYADGGLTDLLQ